MTADQINAAIAESIQWTGSYHHRPDYCGDLNAMWATRKVAAMPYGATDDEAIAFAAELGCKVECLPTGPWHPATRLFIFSEPAESLQS